MNFEVISDYRSEEMYFDYLMENWGDIVIDGFRAPSAEVLEEMLGARAFEDKRHRWMTMRGWEQFESTTGEFMWRQI